eukprot:170277-Prorocentrum_minimum.AAC.2
MHCMQERETDNLGSELVDLERDIVGERQSYEIITAEHLEVKAHIGTTPSGPPPDPLRTPSGPPSDPLSTPFL